MLSNSALKAKEEADREAERLEDEGTVTSVLQSFI